MASIIKVYQIQSKTSTDFIGKKHRISAVPWLFFPSTLIYYDLLLAARKQLPSRSRHILWPARWLLQMRMPSMATLWNTLEVHRSPPMVPVSFSHGGVPQIIQNTDDNLRYLSSETYGFGDPPFWETAIYVLIIYIYICVSCDRNVIFRGGYNSDFSRLDDWRVWSTVSHFHSSFLGGITNRHFENSIAQWTGDWTATS